MKNNPKIMINPYKKQQYHACNTNQNINNKNNIIDKRYYNEIKIQIILKIM